MSDEFVYVSLQPWTKDMDLKPLEDGKVPEDLWVNGMGLTIATVVEVEARVTVEEVVEVDTDQTHGKVGDILEGTQDEVSAV